MLTHLATAVSTHRKSIPPFHYMIALAGGEDIKCADYATFGTHELSMNIINALKDRKMLNGKSWSGCIW